MTKKKITLDDLVNAPAVLINGPMDGQRIAVLYPKGEEPKYRDEYVFFRIPPSKLWFDAQQTSPEKIDLKVIRVSDPYEVQYIRYKKHKPVEINGIQWMTYFYDGSWYEPYPETEE